ncbi:MAG: SDR family NAD(P)-dependent oxidoreductase [Candidatus Hadarchaeales archaeon]
MKVLITGGMGFIGSHTVDLLVEEGNDVRILDNLEEQVHSGKIPEYYNRKAEFILGSVQDREVLAKAIQDVDAVLHLAASVGVGQSMYQINKYVSTNTQGTANLLDVLVNEPNDVKKLVVASSMSVYGEGKYLCEKCGPVYPAQREEERLKRREWEHECPICRGILRPVPTDEDKPLKPTSIYAQTKRHQEEMCLLIGRTYGIPTVVLRYFNVYGSRQSLSNPYTGVCAIFSSRILNNKPPFVFEDGMQMRDFVHVRDVAKANLLSLKNNSANYMSINIGTGKPTSIIALAKVLLKLYGSKLQPYVSNLYRKGDIRHCFADISKAERYLGYKPQISLEEGLEELIEWVKSRTMEALDMFEKSFAELKGTGLVE